MWSPSLSLRQGAGAPGHPRRLDQGGRFTVNERSTGRQYRFVLPGSELTADETDRLPVPIELRGSLGGLRRGERESTARCVTGLSAGRRHMPRARGAAGSRHLRRGCGHPGVGVEVTLVELKDIQLPESMKRAMARQAETEREREAPENHCRRG